MNFVDLRIFRVKFKNGVMIVGYAGVAYIRYKDTFLATDRIKRTYIDAYSKGDDSGN